MRLLLLILPFLLGCDSVEDITYKGYNGLCSRQPDSMSCIKHNSGGVSPDIHTVLSVNYEMLNNFTYITDREKYNVDDYWFDNVTTSIPLSGDCDDVALTFISQLIIDGVNPANIRYVVSGENGEIKHNYAQVKIDSGYIFNFNKIDEYEDMLYMQYDNIGVFVK